MRSYLEGHDLAAIEYGVRSRDGLNGERITEKPTLAMAEDYLAYLQRISATRQTYGIHAELVHRAGPDGQWTVLSSEGAQQIKDEAWEGLDRAMEPVLTAAAEQLFNQTHRVARCGDKAVHAPHTVEHGPDQPRNCPGFDPRLTDSRPSSSGVDGV